MTSPSTTQPTPSPEPPAIEVRNLVKTYAGLTAVNKINFTAARGEIIGFLGPNGAGKSTTMRILTGYLPATSGEAFICGIPVATRSDETKKFIGYMPENNPLPDDMRISEYLHYRGRLKQIPRKKLSRRISEVLDLCDIQRVRHRIIGKLSKGYRQRVGIADAILAEPPVIIMDEPTIGLDPHQILMVRDLIASLRGRMTVIISSHILPEIEVTCDRVVIINQGRIVITGTPAELRKEMFGTTHYTLELAGDISQLDPILSTIDPSLRVTSTEPIPNNPEFRLLTLASKDDTDHGESLLRSISGNSSLRLRSLNKTVPTLEEVFLAATKRSWETIDTSPAKTQG